MRRVWECPVCQRRERSGGEVVNRLCPCGGGVDPPRPTWMRLVEDDPPAKVSDPAPESPGTTSVTARDDPPQVDGEATSP